MLSFSQPFLPYKMGRFHSYFSNAVQILNEYQGEEPFASFLKKYFSQQKKYGSTDRKQIAHLCFFYFRLGKALMEISVEERILVGLFLCSTGKNEMLAQLKPALNEKASYSFEEKCSMFNDQFSIFNVFPWKDELSQEIVYDKFNQSFFIQPDLFLRLRPGQEQIVKQKLQQAEIKFDVISDACLAFINTSAVDKIIELDKEAIVQDYSSQRIAEFLLSVERRPSDRVWDCCAGSGGKSLLLYDLNPNIDLTVSDKRESIIINLKKRFKKAGIKKYKSFIDDLTGKQFAQSPSEQQSSRNYDFIIADVPCTGSGTWSRTPEQLYYFHENKIAEYASLQKKIVSNIIAHLYFPGYLLYITCSVFRKENEEIVDYIKQKFGMEIIKMELLKGYDKKADTMFAALFQLPA